MRSGSVVTMYQDLHERSSIAATVQSSSHRGQIAESFDRDAATLPLRSARFCDALYALTTTNALPQRLCHLSIANIGASATFCHASATLLLRSWRSGQLRVLFTCFPEVGVNLLSSRSTLLRISSNMFGSIFM